MNIYPAQYKAQKLALHYRFISTKFLKSKDNKHFFQKKLCIRHLSYAKEKNQFSTEELQQSKTQNTEVVLLTGFAWY